jgi:hypothetical protein
MVAFDAEGEPEDVFGEMKEVLDSLHGAEITRAVREASMEGRVVPEGSFIGFFDERMVAAGETVGEVARTLARLMVEKGVDLVTLVRGEQLAADELEEIAGEIRDLDEDLEVEVRDGGQPLYPLQMVAE